MIYFYEPRITLLSRPEFLPAPHIDWRADADVEDFSPQYHEPTGAEELVEFAGRLCYLSFGEGTIEGHKAVRGRTTNAEYIEHVLSVAHGSVLEHANWTMLFEGVSRSLTHELVRHRHFSYSQLSQRYVEETNVGFVVPPEIDPNDFLMFRAFTAQCDAALYGYNSQLTLLKHKLEKEGVTGTAAKKRMRQTARALLPNCTETKIVVTGNARAWRFFLQKRGAYGADTEIRRLALHVAKLLKTEAPSIFGDIYIEEEQGIEVLKMKYESV